MLPLPPPDTLAWLQGDAEAEAGEGGKGPAKKGGKPVKESAAVKRMREQVEARRKAEEELKRCVGVRGEVGDEDGLTQRVCV